MKKFSIALNQNQAQKMKLNNYSTTPDGIYLWIGDGRVVERIVGYNKKRGFYADYCYNTGNHWIKDLWINIFAKHGFVTLTRFSR